MIKKFKHQFYQVVPMLFWTGFLFMLIGSCKNINPGYVTDIDGNVYHTIIIGKQVWMVENLKVTRYRNGDSIPNITGRAKWIIQKDGAYCNYDNNDSNAIVYGRLYNWFAVNDNRSIAPEGWHVPSDDEFSDLIKYLGGDSIAGGKMKEMGTTHWLFPNSGAITKKYLSAIPGGYRNSYDGNFYLLRYTGMLWSSTENDTSAWIRTLSNKDIGAFRNYVDKPNGLTVRCIKD